MPGLGNKKNRLATDTAEVYLIQRTNRNQEGKFCCAHSWNKVNFKIND